MLIPIPIGLISAKLISMTIMNATTGSTKEVIKYSSILFAIIVAITILRIVTSISVQKLSSKAIQRCKIDFYKVFLSNPLCNLFSSEYGDTKEKLDDDFNTITSKNLSLYPRFYTGLITVLIYLVFLSAQDIKIALVLFAISLIQIIPPLIVKKYLQVSYENCREIEGNITNFVLESHRGFSEIKLYGLLEWHLNKLKNLHKQYIIDGNISIYASQAEIGMNTLLDNILRYGSYGIVGLLILLDHSSMDIGIEAIALSSGLFQSVKSVFTLISEFSVVKSAEDRVSSWFTGKPPILEEIVSANVVFENASLSYDKNEILKNINLSLDCEKINVIKGNNGVGKSTLLRCIVGLIYCSDGDVKVGDANVTQISDKSFPSKMFFLPQDDAKFGITANELYYIFCPEIACNAVSIAQDFGLSDGDINDTKISDLSGGQRKQVYLSLAFALEPLILLLDEPTNSLDVESNEKLVKLLKRRNGGAIIITHNALFDDISDYNYKLTDGGIFLETN